MAKKVTKKERKRIRRNAFTQRMLDTGTTTVFADRRYVVALPVPGYATRIVVRESF